jgi:PAS domain S-box-containing protein
MFPSDDLEHILNAIADPIFVKDRHHTWVFLNDSYCRFMGLSREHLIGKSDYDFFPKEQAEIFWNRDEVVFETGGEDTNEEEFTDSAGITHSISTRKCLFQNSAGEKFVVACIRDMSALKKTQRQLQDARDHLETMVRQRTAELAAANEALRQQIAETERHAAELRQSQKMEAIGRLAGGIAHDFNNLLSIIVGYASLIQADPATHEGVLNSAEHIAIAAERAAALTRQLLAFSRKQVLKPEVLDLHDILLSMGKLLPPLLGEDVELVIKNDARRAFVEADRGQIEQVVMNLAVNARDAMAAGGELTIETADFEVSERAIGERLKPGQYVLLGVTDTGTGMDPEVQAHIFEPFFTTKELGRGTGLGLATVYAIVTKLGGDIRVSSKPGHGTTIKVYFPCASPAESTIKPAQPAASIPVTPGTVLLVEDEPSLRILLGTILNQQGYRVLQAENGEAALKIASLHAEDIDLLITDIIMPGMRGWELAKQVSSLRPRVSVLYISGHTDVRTTDIECPVSPEELLSKPFKPDALLRRVGEILAARVRTGAA